jgi:hypothetical protein
MNRTVGLGSVVRNQLIGANLAQEGIEVAHTIRDTNWIKQRLDPNITWDAGFVDGNSCVNFNSKTFSDAGFAAGSCNIAAERQLYFIQNRYKHNPTPSGIVTPFLRHIEISHGTDADLKPFVLVKSTVTWEQGAITAEERLYDWK